MSLGLHLVMVAVLVTSVAVFVERATLVAPDRIQIMEIDLNTVRITGEETVLYNTNADTAPKVEDKKPTPAPEPTPTPAPDAPEDKIEAPSLIEPEPEKPDEKPVPTPEPEKPVEPVPAPKKKTIVRVNRDVVSLDRTLTVSVVDALRVAMTRCWNIDTSRAGLSDIRAVAHLTMRQNGTVADVWFESASRAETDSVFAYVLDTIRTAINVCQPLKMLPVGEYEKWKKIQLTFYPTSGKVM